MIFNDSLYLIKPYLPDHAHRERERRRAGEFGEFGCTTLGRPNMCKCRYTVALGWDVGLVWSAEALKGRCTGVGVVVRPDGLNGFHLKGEPLGAHHQVITV